MIHRHKKHLVVTTVLFTLFVFFALFHNLIFALIGFEEPFFFSLALLMILILPFYLIYAFACTLTGIFWCRK